MARCVRLRFGFNPIFLSPGITVVMRLRDSSVKTIEVRYSLANFQTMKAVVTMNFGQLDA
jgi:hypothetical protein